MGRGRKPHAITQPGLQDALDRLIEPTARDRDNPLRWTIKSTHRLARRCENRDTSECDFGAAGCWWRMKYSLQGNRRRGEGVQHSGSGRSSFGHIAERVKARKRRGEPAISVDTKKKEVLGNLKNGGKTYRPKGNPEKVKTHDFPDPKLGKVGALRRVRHSWQCSGVSVGISHDTARFRGGKQSALVGRNWVASGMVEPKRVLVTADGGGKAKFAGAVVEGGVAEWADETGLIVEVSHYPPGRGKWNKIEHRVFCHITRNWQGTPLELWRSC